MRFKACAISSGVSPKDEIAFFDAPRLSKVLITCAALLAAPSSVLGAQAAKWSGVWPSSSAAVTFAWCWSNSDTIGWLPVDAAVMSGVRPLARHRECSRVDDSILKVELLASSWVYEMPASTGGASSMFGSSSPESTTEGAFAGGGSSIDEEVAGIAGKRQCRHYSIVVQERKREVNWSKAKTRS